jgi:hypothetical protein
LSITNQRVLDRYINIIQSKNAFYTKRAAAARNIRLISDEIQINPLISSLKEEAPRFDLPSIVNLSREVSNQPQLLSKILKSIITSIKYYEMKIELLKSIQKNSIDNPCNPEVGEILIDILNISLRTDRIIAYIRRAMFLLTMSQRRIINKKFFELNKMKIGFQKIIISILGKSKYIHAIEPLFRIYSNGTSRLCKDTNNALDQFEGREALLETLRLYEELCKQNDPHRSTKYEYLLRLFVNYDVIDIFTNLPEYRNKYNTLIRDVLLKQGTMNLNKLSFIREKLTLKEDIQFIDEIIEILQPKIEIALGLNVIL